MQSNLSFSSLKPRITGIVLLLFLASIWLLTYSVQVRLENEMRELLGAKQPPAVSCVTSEMEEIIRARIQMHAVQVAGGLSVLVIAMVWIVVARLLRPLSVAAAYIKDIATGGDDFRELPVTRHDEIGELLASFNTLLLQRRKAEEELYRSRQMLQLVLDHVPQRVFWKDMNLNYIGCNQSFADDCGVLEPARIIGKSDFDLSWKELADLYRADDRAVLETREPKLNYEESATRSDGSVFWVITNKVPLLDSDGTVFGVLGTYEDITERKRIVDRIRMNEKRLESIIAISQSNTESIQDLLDNALEAALTVTYSKIGYIYHYDGEKQEFTLNSYSKDVMKECSIAERSTLYHLENTGLWGEAVRQGKTILLNDFQAEHPLKRGYPEGHAPLTRFLTLPVYNQDKIVAVVGVANKESDYDQTDVLQLTLLLDAVWKMVVRIMGEQELREARDAAEAANRAKSEFLANMSHEIRTPLNAVIGLALLLQDTELNARQQDYLLKILSSSRALLGVLNDILDYSKIEAGRLDLEEVDFNLEDILENVVNLFSAKAEEQGLEMFFEVKSDVPFNLRGDPLRLGQVLNNLVGNAVKFTRKGEIHVKTELLEKTEDRALMKFSVRDTGIGLSPDLIDQPERLFRPFTQADSTITRKFGGTGLGLAISNHIVELMGGKIEVESVSGEGSTFHFTTLLRLGRALPARRDPLGLERRRVLVVDDQETSLHILEQTFRSWSFDVSTARSGEEALRKSSEARLEGRPFELFLLDWKMPGLDGLDVARHIQQEACRLKVKKPPIVIMVTAYGREELVAAAGDMHPDAILLKPYTPSALFDILMGVRSQTFPGPALESPGIGELFRKTARIRGASILLVEDNPVNQQVAREFLEKAGLVVEIAADGREAVDKVKLYGHYDLVLMDLQMPGMDGFEATRLIRGMERGKELPIIAMTAAAMRQDRDATARVGMNGHIAKPVDPNELVQALLTWIEPRGCAWDGDATGASGDAPSPVSVSPPEPAGAAATLPEVPGFDLSGMLARIGGNAGAIAGILRSFAAQFAGLPERLDRLLAGGDYEGAAFLIHGVKGAAGNIGATELHRAAREFEGELRAGAAASRAMFETALAGALDGIASILSSAVEGGVDGVGGVARGAGSTGSVACAISGVDGGAEGVEGATGIAGPAGGAGTVGLTGPEGVVELAGPEGGKGVVEAAGAVGAETTATDHDMARLSGIIRQVAGIMEQYEIVPEDLVRTLSGMLREKVAGEVIASLERQVDSFDYIAALSTLEEIAARLGIAPGPGADVRP